jgi:hypothetical protein
MTRKQENVIILGIFTLLLMTVLGINMFSAPENIRYAGSAPAFTIPAQAVPSAEAGKRPGTQPPDVISRQEAAAGAWGRDPFASSWLNESSTAAMSGEGLTVTLILISATKKIAAINHRICQEGDMVGDEKIIAIKRDGVILEKNGTRRGLSLPKSIFQF